MKRRRNFSLCLLWLAAEAAPSTARIAVGCIAGSACGVPSSSYARRSSRSCCPESAACVCSSFFDPPEICRFFYYNTAELLLPCRTFTCHVFKTRSRVLRAGCGLTCLAFQRHVNIFRTASVRILDKPLVCWSLYSSSRDCTHDEASFLFARVSHD